MSNKEKRKNEILSKLMTIKKDTATADLYQKWIDQVIAYIKE